MTKGDEALYSKIVLDKLGIQSKSDQIREKANGDSSKLEFKIANDLITARDVGYAAATVDAIEQRPKAKIFNDVEEALDAWEQAIRKLIPQFPS